MNGASIHLFLNHFPIIGLLIGLGILAAGIFFKQPILKMASFILILLASVTTMPVNISGEAAEEIVEEMHDGRGHDLIHEHEEAAELALFLMLAIGIIALAGIVMQRRNHPRQNMVASALLGLGIIAFGYIAYVGHLGGEISHPEIRAGFELPEGHDHDHEEESHEDDD